MVPVGSMTIPAQVWVCLCRMGACLSLTSCASLTKCLPRGWLDLLTVRHTDATAALPSTPVSLPLFLPRQKLCTYVSCATFCRSLQAAHCQQNRPGLRMHHTPSHLYPRSGRPMAWRRLRAASMRWVHYHSSPHEPPLQWSGMLAHMSRSTRHYVMLRPHIQGLG